MRICAERSISTPRTSSCIGGRWMPSRRTTVRKINGSRIGARALSVYFCRPVDHRAARPAGGSREGPVAPANAGQPPAGSLRRMRDRYLCRRRLGSTSRSPDYIGLLHGGPLAGLRYLWDGGTDLPPKNLRVPSFPTPF